MTRIIVADRLAHRLADLDVVVGIARRMDLVGLPAGRLERLRLIDIGGDVRQHLRTGIAGIEVRNVPISACTGSPAILPARSHSAVSTAPMVR